VAWPIVTLILAGALVFRGDVARLLRLVRKVTAGGVTVEFSADDARRVQESIEQPFREFNKAAHRAYDQAVYGYSIRKHASKAWDAFPDLVKKHVKDPSTWILPDDARATVHVEDVVVKEFMYQLLDYLPRGGGSGRRFSVRRGILGRAWRLEASYGTTDALDPAKTRAQVGGSIVGHSEADAALVESWGMTWEDVAEWKHGDKRSCLCVVLRDSRDPNSAKSTRVPVAVLYVDCETPKAFGSTDAEARAVAVALEDEDVMRALGNQIAKAMEDLRKKGMYLDLTSAG